VGFYAELASAPKNAYGNWPPRQQQQHGRRLVLEEVDPSYDDSLRFIREHYCAALPIPSGCVLDRVPEWVGIKLLGTGPGAGEQPKQVTLAAWTYARAASCATRTPSATRS